MLTEDELANKVIYTAAQIFRGLSGRELAAVTTPVINSVVRKGAWHSEADVARARQLLIDLKERRQLHKAAVGATDTSELAAAIKTNARAQAALNSMQGRIDQMIRKNQAPATAPAARPVTKAAGTSRPAAVSRRAFVVAGPRANPLAVEVAKRAAAQRVVAPIVTGGGITIGFAGR